MQKNWLVINLNKKYFLKAGNKIFNCQIGSGGLKNPLKKIEGDQATPIGKWCLISLYYRPDRILRPKLKKKKSLKINQITKNCGWCDDTTSNYYNKYLKTNNSWSQIIHFESLWRVDNAYDILIVISYNIKPTIKNKGSAIFLHCSFLDNRSTSGCVAIKKRDLIYLLKTLERNTYIKIKN